MLVLLPILQKVHLVVSSFEKVSKTNLNFPFSIFNIYIYIFKSFKIRFIRDTIHILSILVSAPTNVIAIQQQKDNNKKTIPIIFPPHIFTLLIEVIHFDFLFILEKVNKIIIKINITKSNNSLLYKNR